MATNENKCERCDEIRKMIAERNAIKYHDRSLYIDDNALQNI